MLISWVGGKHKLANEIINIFPSHKRYIEPFFGGGWVFFMKPHVRENIINDINSDLVNLYLVIRDQPQDLARLIFFTPKSRDLFNKYIDLYWNRKEEWVNTDKVTRAMIYFYIIKNSFGSLLRHYGVFSTKWDVNEIVEAILPMSEKLKNVDIMCDDWRNIIDLYTNKDTLVYLDPPYIVTIGRGEHYYQYTFTREQHIELRDKLVADKDKYKWVLSYDTHPFVNELYNGIDGINILETSAHFQSLNAKYYSLVDYDDTNKYKKEYLITNFNIEKALPLFKEGIQHE